MIKLTEGGNVFKDAQGNPLTQRINQADVPATIAFVGKLLGMEFPQDRWLGSTGRKPTSGDLDIAVDTSKATKEQIAAALSNWVQRSGGDPREFVKKSGEVHFRTPIKGDPRNGYVQTDFMFLSNVDWGTFYYGGAEDSAYKGMNRNVLMSSLAKSQGLKVGLNGMISRTTNQLVNGGLDPDYVASVLLGKGFDRKSLKNVETIYKALEQDPQRDAKLADFREYLAREGLGEPGQVKENTEVNFLAKLRDRIINQGMTPLIEQEAANPYQIYEAKEPRIPYVEDLVFKTGLAGASQAINIIKQTAKNTRDYATIKWDGSPAVIFGRKPNGEFVLTDKSGATAVGYDGLATSPDMIDSIMARRDAGAAGRGKQVDRTDLAGIYREIWPYFERAVPKNFRGYIKGDLLFTPGRPWVEDAGNLVFQPNQHGGIVYRIPVDSPLGQQIANSQVGIAIHTQMEDPNSVEQPLTDPSKVLEPVPGLLATSATVKNLQNLKLSRDEMANLTRLTTGQNAQALSQLLNPAELRAQQITDLPALMEKFINSLKGTDYSGATPAQFGTWLSNNVNPRKYNNIIEHLKNPQTNILGMNVAFDIWNAVHNLKMNLQRQLDLQHPGQEGWVFATPAGRAKIVSRTAGGFADPTRKAQARM
jgi:hypothetical protein